MDLRCIGMTLSVADGFLKSAVDRKLLHRL